MARRLPEEAAVGGGGDRGVGLLAWRGGIHAKLPAPGPIGLVEAAAGDPTVRIVLRCEGRPHDDKTVASVHRDGGPLGPAFTASRRARRSPPSMKLLGAVAGEPELRAYVEAHRTLWRSAGDQVRTLTASLAAQRGVWATALDRLETIPGVGRSSRRRSWLSSPT